MAKVDDNPKYQYYVDKKVSLFDRIVILNLLIAEGVQPGEVLRLVTRGADSEIITDRLYKMETRSSFSFRSYRQPNQDVVASVLA